MDMLYKSLILIWRIVLDRISTPINPPMGTWSRAGSLPIAGKEPGMAGDCDFYRASRWGRTNSLLTRNFGALLWLGREAK